MVTTFSRFTILPACWTEQLGIKIQNSNSTLLEIFQSHTCSPKGDEGRGRRRGTTVCHLRRRKEKGAGLHLVLMRLSYKSASVSKEDNGKGQKLIRLAFH